MITTVHPIILNIDASPGSCLQGDGLSVRLALPADSWSVPQTRQKEMRLSDNTRGLKPASSSRRTLLAHNPVIVFTLCHVSFMPPLRHSSDNSDQEITSDYVISFWMVKSTPASRHTAAMSASCYRASIPEHTLFSPHPTFCIAGDRPSPDRPRQYRLQEVWRWLKECQEDESAGRLWSEDEHGHAVKNELLDCQ